MIARFYLVIDSRGVDRMTKTRPSTLKRGEISVEVNLTVPNEIFLRPAITANISVERGSIGKFPDIQLESVVEAVHAATGLDIVLEVKESE